MTSSVHATGNAALISLIEEARAVWYCQSPRYHGDVRRDPVFAYGPWFHLEEDPNVRRLLIRQNANDEGGPIRGLEDEYKKDAKHAKKFFEIEIVSIDTRDRAEYAAREPVEPFTSRREVFGEKYAPNVDGMFWHKSNDGTLKFLQSHHDTVVLKVFAPPAPLEVFIGSPHSMRERMWNAFRMNRTVCKGVAFFHIRSLIDSTTSTARLSTEIVRASDGDKKNFFEYWPNSAEYFHLFDRQKIDAYKQDRKPRLETFVRPTVVVHDFASLGVSERKRRIYGFVDDDNAQRF